VRNDATLSFFDGDDGRAGHADLVSNILLVNPAALRASWRRKPKVRRIDLL